MPDLQFVCMACGTAPDGRNQTHGWCRIHGLERLVESGFSTPEEKERLAFMRNVLILAEAPRIGEEAVAADKIRKFCYGQELERRWIAR